MKSGLVRRKVTVKGRKGTYQRSVMVRQDQGGAKLTLRAYKPVTASQMLRRHGGAILARGAATGMAAFGGSWLGGAGAHTLSKGNRTATTIGMLLGAHYGSQKAMEAVYSGRRGQKIVEDMRGGTRGAKLTAGVLHIAAHVGAGQALRHGMNRLYRR